jgi:transposase
VGKNRKMRDLSEFGTEQILGAHLAGASVTKTAPLLGVSRATVSKVMSAYTNHGTTTSAKKNSGRKSTLTERDCRTLRTAELKFPQERYDVTFTNPPSTVGLQLLYL